MRQGQGDPTDPRDLVFEMHAFQVYVVFPQLHHPGGCQPHHCQGKTYVLQCLVVPRSWPSLFLGPASDFLLKFTSIYECLNCI